MSAVDRTFPAMRVVEVTHYDPIARRYLRLAVSVEDLKGHRLHDPEVIDVLAFTLRPYRGFPQYEASYEDGTLPMGAGHALCREFNARLKSDENLREWLRQAVNVLGSTGII